MARLGIDFGTSTTVAVLAVPGREPRPLLIDGSPLMPSAVYLDPDGTLIVGRDALHLGLAGPGLLEPNPKRRVDEGTVLLGDTEVPVVRLFAAVLGRVVAEASAMSDAPLEEVVVTCPAAWGSQRRQVLLDAAPAGTRLVAEPVAAAHYFADVAGHQVPVGATALVYDFGAGTFDASVVRRTGQGFELLATLGLDDTGGLDIDAAVLAHLRDTVADPEGHWARLTGPADAGDRRMARQVWDNIRTAKEMLSRLPSTLVHLPLFNVEVPLDRDTLDRLAAPVLQRTVATGVEVLAVAGEPIQSLAAVFLAGGSSRMPAVTAALQRALGLAPVVVDQPELAVAEGSLRDFTQPHSPTSGLPAAGLPVPGQPAGGFAVPGPPAGGAPVPVAPHTGQFPAVAVQPFAAGTPSGAFPVVAAPPAGRGRRRALLIGAGVVLLAVLAGGGYAVAALRGGGKPTGDVAAGAVPLPSPSASAPASASPSPSVSPAVSVAAGLDPCLVGTWRQTSSTVHVTDGSKKIQFTGGAGTVQSFDAEGHTVYDQNATEPYRASYEGANWEEVFRGVVRANYRIIDGAVAVSGQSGEISWVVNRNGKRNNSGKSTLSLKPERYLCQGDKLIQYGPDGDYTNELSRVGPPMP